MTTLYDRLADAVRSCAACSLSGQDRGVPGMWVLKNPHTPSLDELRASTEPIVMVLGEAPGGVEMIQGKPFVGQSGELLHSLFDEVGLTSYYLSNIAKCRPPVVKGKQQAPDKVTTEACAPFLRAEFELVKPTHLILLGKSAAKLVVEGNFSMKDVVNTTVYYPHRPVHTAKGKLIIRAPEPIRPRIPSLTLYHPSYFLRSRTAPWVQKQIREWKSSLKMFLGEKAPTYRVERVNCEVHD